MTTDPFTDAAMEHLAKVDHDKSREWFDGFVACTRWARDHLARQEATDAEKQSLEMKIHRVEKLLEAAMNAYDGKDALYQVTPSVSVHKIREALGETESR